MVTFQCRTLSNYMFYVELVPEINIEIRVHCKDMH